MIGVPQDRITKAGLSIDYPHHEIHSGDHYFFNHCDDDVDILGPKYLRITTPNTTKWAHLLCHLYSSGAGKWEFYENPTINAAGTAGTIYNNNRNSTKTSAMVCYYDTTTTSDGTLLWSERTGADGIGGSQSGSGISREEEIILKQNEDYVLKFTPDADNAKVCVTFKWYEHTNE